jgi:hypothetical protein
MEHPPYFVAWPCNWEIASVIPTSYSIKVRCRFAIVADPVIIP